MRFILRVVIVFFGFFLTALCPSPSLQHYEVVFDLHSCDCGAPDCYRTIFSFDWDIERETPELLPIRVSETGCVESPTKTADFERVVVNSTCWSYYSPSLGFNLLLKWSNNAIVEAYCVHGGIVKDWKEIRSYLDKSCVEDSRIEVYRLRPLE